MSVEEKGGYVYKILMDGESKWVARSFLVPTFLSELCEFY